MGNAPRTSDSDPRLTPLNPVLQLKLAEMPGGISVKEAFLPEEFGEHIDRIINGDEQIFRFFAITKEGDIWAEQIEMLVDETGNQVGAVLTSTSANFDGMERIYNSVRRADQRFHYEPDGLAIARGEWDERWDHLANDWKIR